MHRIFEDGGWRRGALYDRDGLRPGDHLTGPAVIVELSATTYLPSGWMAEVDGFSNLRLAPAQLKRGGRR
jgi:N-methylhydantoinase A/oxoprolinase/acetone carboxylase beta subunit